LRHPDFCVKHEILKISLLLRLLLLLRF